MNEHRLQSLLDALRSGEVGLDDALEVLRALPFTDLEFARVDHQREASTGLVEAVYAPGKTPEQCAAIVTALLEQPGGPVLLTRADDAQIAAAVEMHPPAIRREATVAWRPAPECPPAHLGDVVVVTGGTGDLTVAGESETTLVAYGYRPEVIADVGVAGLHRLLAYRDRLERASAVIVVAGMEAALASVVAGLTRAPIVAVPTSTGYGASFHGVTALLGMLASCSPGVTVVGIDNGFGAACAVTRMRQTLAPDQPDDRADDQADDRAGDRNPA